MGLDVGIKVQLSNNQTCLGKDGKPHPFRDICDDLVGLYPKTFKFVGWHPHCRCFATSVLKTEKEIQADNKRILKGEEPLPKSKNEVKKAPQAFVSWIKQNKDRIAAAESRGTLPYFLRDNEQWYKETAKRKVKPKTQSKRNLLEVAAQRHADRTPQDFEQRKLKVWDWQLQRHYANLSEEERKALTENWLKIEKALGITKGRMMSVEEADKQSANPYYQPKFIMNKDTDRWKYNPEYKKEYATNCQTCSPAYMLRLWGFDIVAKGNTEGSLSEYLSKQRSFEVWKNKDGSQARPILQKDWLYSKGYKQMTEKRWREYFIESCKEEGVYLLTIGWKKGGGHATILQKTKQGLFYIEPQVYNPKLGAKRPILELCQDGDRNPISTRGILRIDNKVFDTKFLSIFEKS